MQQKNPPRILIESVSEVLTGMSISEEGLTDMQPIVVKVCLNGTPLELGKLLAYVAQSDRTFFLVLKSTVDALISANDEKMKAVHADPLMFDIFGQIYLMREIASSLEQMIIASNITTEQWCKIGQLIALLASVHDKLFSCFDQLSTRENKKT